MRTFIQLALLLTATVSFAAAPPLLPPRFAGWEKTATRTSADPAVADPAHASLLKEYGFVELESATYSRPGRTLTVKAARFADASGAYGAFTFYKQPEMGTEKIGEQGASVNNQVLFYRGNMLVDAVFDRVTAMSAAELRQLADALPLAAGEQQKPPTIPLYLPKQAYVRNSARYVHGPVALAAVGAPVGAELVDFSKSPEIALGKYTSSDGIATLTVIAYPTPQIAAERLRAIEASMQGPAGAQANADSFLAKRTGPIVALVTGSIPPGEAKALLASVNYDADVTWNENTGLSRRDNIGDLILNIFLLIGFLLLIMFFVGFMFGGARIALRKLMPGRVREEKPDFIRLDLR